MQLGAGGLGFSGIVSVSRRQLWFRGTVVEIGLPFARNTMGDFKRGIFETNCGAVAAWASTFWSYRGEPNRRRDALGSACGAAPIPFWFKTNGTDKSHR